MKLGDVVLSDAHSNRLPLAARRLPGWPSWCRSASIVLLWLLPLLIALPLGGALYRLGAVLWSGPRVPETTLARGLLSAGDTLWPALLALFYGLLVLMGAYGVVMLVFAQRRRKGRTKPLTDVQGWPSMSVLVPAYNEEAVICATLRSLLASDYPGTLQLLVVNDGSTDNTGQLVQDCFAHEARVRLLNKVNGGKASALNHGLSAATGVIVTAIDADTLLHPRALRHLAANFVDENVGAVCGNMQVGNLVNEWTRLQAIEYTCANNIERRAHEHLGCITVVPGAIGAFRHSVLYALGGYYQDTLAEDADLTVRILRAGWRVVYEEAALARTEAPQDWSGFVKQRMRWSYGKLQLVCKHRAAIFNPRYHGLGWIGLPCLVMFNFVLPLFAFLTSWMQVLLLLTWCVAPGWMADLSLVAPVSAPVIPLLASLFALGLLTRISVFVSRRRDSKVPGSIVLPSHGLRPFLRYVGGTPVRWLMGVSLTLTIYCCLARSLSGRATHWNKLSRCGTVDAEFNA